MKNDLTSEYLLSIGYYETNDSLVWEYNALYDWHYIMVFEGYAYVLYLIYPGKMVSGATKDIQVPIQDFREIKEFETFWKILIRKSMMD